MGAKISLGYDSQMTVDASNLSLDLTELLACPLSDRPLELQDEGFVSTGSNTTFPIVNGIPWLFADPETTLADWRGRVDRACKQYLYDAEGIDHELKSTVSELTKQRLVKTRDALRDQSQRLADFMSPLGRQSQGTNFYTYLALRTRLPTDHGINTYYANIHRDWSWGDEENQTACSLILEHARDPLGKTLVLGSGAGRLAYDLHTQSELPLTISFDFNPLLLFVGQQMFQGKTIKLFEFPLAPKNPGHGPVLRTLKAPASATNGLVSVAGDVRRPPFKANSFDTVITPWLIDVIDEPLKQFSKRINQLLKPGGQWINFGSLAFSHSQQTHNLSQEETLFVIGESGFEVHSKGDHEIDYMCSPDSRHGRRETVFCFCAQKTNSVEPPTRHASLPNWIVKGDTAVPKLRSFETQAMTTRVYAFLMALVDGKRTIKDMAKLMVDQQLLDPQDAELTVKSFVIKMYEESQKG